MQASKPNRTTGQSLEMQGLAVASTLFLTLALCAGSVFGQQVLHVAQDGNNDWPGSAAKPLANLSGAQNAIRKIKATWGLPEGGIEVRVHTGTYRKMDVLKFGAEDSGTLNAPIIYRALEKGKVRLSGGIKLTGFTPVANPKVLPTIVPEARDKIWQINIKEQGIAELGKTVSLGPRAELFFNDQPMVLARWPNQGYTFITKRAPYSANAAPYLFHRTHFVYHVSMEQSRWTACSAIPSGEEIGLQ